MSAICSESGCRNKMNWGDGQRDGYTDRCVTAPTHTFSLSLMQVFPSDLLMHQVHHRAHGQLDADPQVFSPAIPYL